MKFKLAYKSYSFGISLASSKRFTDNTGLSLHCVLMDYIVAYTELQGQIEAKRISELSKLYDRKIVCDLLHAITDDDLNIPLEEFEDATYRTSWVQSDAVDGFSEPWALVVCAIAFDVHDYISKNIHVKKKDIKAV